MASTDFGSTLESNRAAGTRLELLLFRLDSSQLYGINVFKVQEVVPWQPMSKMARSHPLVLGVATLRNRIVSVIDLSLAMKMPALHEPEKGQIIVTEYNRSVHGFLIRRVEKIIHTQWNQVQQLPTKLGQDTYATAVTLVDKELVQILDVEKVLDQVVQAKTNVSGVLTEQRAAQGLRVLVVDDSSVARLQIQRALEQLGIECTLTHDGLKALDLLEQMIADGVDIAEHFLMIISDIEMPEMDGYELTTRIRANPRTNNIYILLHSSISGVFNVSMVKRTGANKFIQKYHPDDLAKAVLGHLQQKSHTS
ncbi:MULTISPECIES: chemotaxis protein CheV [Thiorhodovibrio]|uniref:chemotaxis protein CheV n=1 Tax=Thiorhodovibrio TaxID=61593 RepID=UPI001912DFCE|nr:MULTISPECIES: chemotaxis protein CheV [Thiorhodovibrio]MBK5971206.1 chemotaxis protein CheW [Thiorhodovibrio winogradskyi]WPL14645.1 Chemotaxis protein CheV [Thiorhodovibrio litoralis]